jgi:hypothetical protein
MNPEPKQTWHNTTYLKNKIIYNIKQKIKNLLRIQKPISMEQILQKFSPGYPHRIECGPGWHPLIISIHQEIEKIDPDYTILQIKEKYGGLRFYYATNSRRHNQIDRKVHYYEDKSYEVCEITGRPGKLMKKDGIYKTLHSSFYKDGWNFS